MAIFDGGDRYEFDLTIKHYGYKRQSDPYVSSRISDEKPKEELKEKLTFNARTAVEVVRKLLDYLQ